MPNVRIKAERKLHMPDHDPADRELSRLVYRVLIDMPTHPPATAEEKAAAQARVTEIHRQRFGPDFPPGRFPDWMYGKRGRPKDE